MSSRPEGEAKVAWLGKVRDVAPAGIGLHVPVRVVHATPGKNGRWLIGCEFAPSLSEDELQTLIWE